MSEQTSIHVNGSVLTIHHRDDGTTWTFDLDQMEKALAVFALILKAMK